MRAWLRSGRHHRSRVAISWPHARVGHGFRIELANEFPAVLEAFAEATPPTRSAPAKIANEACGSKNCSVDSLSGHQLSDSLARVKHTRLHGVLWDAGDLGDLFDRLLMVVDEVDDLTMG